MQNDNPLVFELEKEEKPVTIAGEAYVLIELDGRGRDRYLTALSKRLRVDAKGKTAGVRDFDNMQADLISASLRKIEPGGRVPVDIKTIQSWPARVVVALFEAAKELSALGKDDEDEDEGGEENEEKND